MCGRYIIPDESALEREWRSMPRDFRYFQSFNLAPTQVGPIALEADGKRKVMPMVWGFQPHWSKRSWINARAETVLESRAFSRAARRQRCLVIAAGWYEWTGSKAPKQPYLFTRTDRRSFAFAGIWTTRTVDDEDISTFAILTTAATDMAAPIHHRMPLVVDPLAYDCRLSPDADPQDYSAVLNNPLDHDGLEVYPVSKAVNSPKNKSPECIKPMSTTGTVSL